MLDSQRGESRPGIVAIVEVYGGSRLTLIKSTMTLSDASGDMVAEVA